MWNGSPAIQVNWITWCTRLGLLRQLPDRAGGKRNESSTMPGQIMLMSTFSGEPVMVMAVSGHAGWP
jgi:hypothetical protein